MRDDRFERLFDEHATLLLNFLLFKTGNRAVAEDLVSDAFEKVLTRRRLFDRRRGNEKTWLYSIALNCLRDHYRRADAEERALERNSAGLATDTEIDIGAMGDRQVVMQALRKLADEERDAIALRFGGGLTNPEIAELLGEPLTTVEGRVYRALRKLRADIG